MKLDLKDAEIPCTDITVTLWYVRELRGVFFPTKMAAEMAARQRWPDESPDARYARVYSTDFIDAMHCTVINDEEHEK